MKIVPLTLIAFLTLLNSCGPSAEELKKNADDAATKQQQLIDSTAKATAAQVESKIHEQRLAEQREIKAKETEAIRLRDSENLKDKIFSLESEIEIQTTKYNDLKAPKFLRTADEKEAQLRAQLLVVRRVQIELEFTREQLKLLENGQHYTMPQEYRNSNSIKVDSSMSR
jgi:predicted DNA-binding protein (UPF0251 family)